MELIIPLQSLIPLAVVYSMDPWLIMLKTLPGQSLVNWLPLMVPEVFVLLANCIAHLTADADPVVDLGVRDAEPAIATKLLPILVLDLVCLRLWWFLWLLLLLSMFLAWLLLLVLVLWRLVVWLLLPPLWLWCQLNFWLQLLIALLILHANGFLFLGLSAIGFRKWSYWTGVCREDHDYLKPPSESGKLIWIGECLDCKSHFIPYFRPCGPTFCWWYIVSLVFSNPVNQTSTSPTNCYSCY